MAGHRIRGRRLARFAAMVTTLVLLLGCAPPPAPSPTAAPAKPAEAPTTAPSPAAAAPTTAAAPATAQSPAAAPTAAASPAAAPSKPTAAAEATKPAAGRRPEIDLDLSHTEVDPGETFTFHVQARSPSGVGSVWWWATSTDDDNLADTHPFDCGGAALCRKSYSVSTQDRGRITIHAQARDTDGQLSDESKQDLRVR